MGNMLSEHFSLVELSSSAHREFDNTPPPAAVANLKLLAVEVLEPTRAIVGPMHPDSGYRSFDVNKAVGGQPNSQHCDGSACDFTPIDIDLIEAARRILASKVPYDQMIFEYGRWIHLSRAPAERPPRREALMIGDWTRDATGHMRYLPLDISKLPKPAAAPLAPAV